METIEINSALVPLGEDKVKADIFFDIPLINTDWDAFRVKVQAGEVTSTKFLEAIKSMEPLHECDYRLHQHWVLQQQLRLCLLHEAGKPLESKKRMCEVCAKHKADPLYDDEDRWQIICLQCSDEHTQMFNGGGRGSCEFLRPVYNHRSHSWGLLYYYSHGSRDPFIFWLADFYKTRLDAQMALQPFKHYGDWLDRKYNGMLSFWNRFSRMISVEDALNMKLPLTPESFREVLRSKIQADMDQEQQVMSYYVRETMEAHRRKERD